MIKIRISNIIFSYYYYYYYCKLIRCNEINISIKKLGQNNVSFPHPIGIVLGLYSKIGKNSVIYQNVTLGSKTMGEAIIGGYSVVGENVVIYGNSMIIGSVKIGNNSVIGAGSIITKNVPPNSIAFGVNKIKAQN